MTPLKFATAAAAGLLALAACSSDPPKPPTEAMNAAQLAIANAEQARAEEYARPELLQARAEFGYALRAVEQKDMVVALRMAEEARAGAELASARAEEAQAEVFTDERQLKSGAR